MTDPGEGARDGLSAAVDGAASAADATGDALSDAADATVGQGVVALDAPSRMAERHALFRTQRWPQDLLQPLQAHHLPAGSAVAEAGLFYARSRAIRPDRLVAHLTAGLPVRYDTEVTGMTVGDGMVRLETKDGAKLVFDAVVLASGADLQGLLVDAGMSPPLGISHGQVSHVPASADTATFDACSAPP